MAVGEFRNISGSNTVVLNRIGWELGVGETIAFDDDDKLNDDLLLIEEIEAAVQAGDLEVRDSGLAVVALADIQDFLRADTITTGELEDESVTKDKLNVSDSGDAVITNIVAGTGITLSETGADPGTGAVTVNVDGASIDTSRQIIVFIHNRGVANSGESWFEWDQKISLIQANWFINNTFNLKRLKLSVDKRDSSRAYGVKLYASSNLYSPVFSSGTVLGTNQWSGELVVPQPEQHSADDYVWSCYRTSGQGKSKFKRVVFQFDYTEEI